MLIVLPGISESPYLSIPRSHLASDIPFNLDLVVRLLNTNTVTLEHLKNVTSKLVCTHFTM